MKWKIEAARHVLLFVGASFGIVRGAIDARNVPVLPDGQLLRAHRVDGLLIGQARETKRTFGGRATRICIGRGGGTA